MSCHLEYYEHVEFYVREDEDYQKVINSCNEDLELAMISKIIEVGGDELDELQELWEEELQLTQKQIDVIQNVAGNEKIFSNVLLCFLSDCVRQVFILQ